MPGLMRYLYGPGRKDEHTQQHMVASSGQLSSEWAGMLSASEAGQVGRIVEAAWREQYVEQEALVGGRTGGRVLSASLVADGTSRDAEREHVYHVSLSLAPGESWSDEQWATVAGDFAAGMGFTTGPGDGQGSSWVAVRHGVSEGGNDHIHIAANLVRQDGARVQMPRNDYALANAVRRQIEQRRAFVTPLHEADRAVEGGLSLPAYSQKEAADARVNAEHGYSGLPDRVQLQRIVRAAASTSSSEVEFIAAVSDEVDIHAARWSPGERSVVTGYRVRFDENSRWFTATQLAPDLTLQKLRAGWADSPQERADAAAVWRGQAPAPVRATPLSAQVELTRATEYLSAWNVQLAGLDPHDKAAWKRETAHAAAVMSTLSVPAAPFADHLGPAADHLTRTSLPSRAPVATNTPPQTGLRLRNPGGAGSVGRGELAARQVMLAVRATGEDTGRGWYAVLQQMSRTSRAIHDASLARSELVAARAVTTQVIDRLEATIQTVDDAQARGPVSRDLSNLSDEAREALEASLPGRSTGRHINTDDISHEDPYRPRNPRISADRDRHRGPRR